MKAILSRTLGLLLAATLPATPREASQAPPPVAEDASADALQVLGRRALRPGDSLAIVGRVASRGNGSRDEFELTAAVPCEVRIFLRPTLPGADLRVSIRDPLDGSVLARDSGTRGHRTAVLGVDAAGRELRVVVESAWGASTYLLEVEAGPLIRGPRE